ncbi:MAG: hypothetical protein AB7U05_01825 [Mangrovibacterium sp.]
MNFQIDATKFTSDLEMLTEKESLINTSYLLSYNYFVDYFKKLAFVEEEHVAIAAHFVYGWMPTILSLDYSKMGEVAASLNKIKNNEVLSVTELETVKACVNNSLVGASKLLHFVSPNRYAIWDSNIFRYFSAKRSTYGIDKVEHYLQYLEALKSFAETSTFQRLKPRIEALCHPVSDLRAIEFVLFESVRLHKHKSTGSNEIVNLSISI